MPYSCRRRRIIVANKSRISEMAKFDNETALRVPLGRREINVLA